MEKVRKYNIKHETSSLTGERMPTILMNFKGFLCLQTTRGHSGVMLGGALLRLEPVYLTSAALGRTVMVLQ